MYSMPWTLKLLLADAQRSRTRLDQNQEENDLEADEDVTETRDDEDEKKVRRVPEDFASIRGHLVTEAVGVSARAFSS